MAELDDSAIGELFESDFELEFKGCCEFPALDNSINNYTKTEPSLLVLKSCFFLQIMVEN